MIVLEVLAEQGELRFTRLSEQVPGISYKMLTQTLRLMEREGFVARTIHPVIPPKVEYKLTELGVSLAIAFCGVWMWAEGHLEQVEQARTMFDQKWQSQDPDIRRCQQLTIADEKPTSIMTPTLDECIGDLAPIQISPCRHALVEPKVELLETN